MGPPTLVDGDAEAAAAEERARHGFNGAADSRRRRPELRPPRPHGPGRLHGAADSRRRRQRGYQVSTARAQQASMGPPTLVYGDYYCEDTDSVCALHASMGPPTLVYGDGARRKTRVSRPRSFNGA